MERRAGNVVEQFADKSARQSALNAFQKEMNAKNMAYLKQLNNCNSDNRIEKSFQKSYDLLRTYSQKQSDVDQLSTVLIELEKKTHFDTNKEKEHKDIESAINELIREILKRMGSSDKTCLEFEISTAGGYFDGTKVCFPDEFDFLVDICALSNYFATKSEGEIALDRWSDDSSKVNVRTFGEISPSVSGFFNSTLLEESVIGCDIRKAGPPGTIMNRQFANVFADQIKSFMVSLIALKYSVTRPTGKLTIMTDLEDLLNDQLSSSFLTVYVLWAPNSEESKPLGISVDVTPSFRLPPGYMRFNEVYFNMDAYRIFSDRLGKENCYLRLVLRDDRNWRMSLSHAETELIRNEDPIHRKCHRILKLLKEGTQLEVQDGQIPDAKYMERKARSTKFTEMCTSYAVKTVVMSHLLSCEKPKLGSCFISMLLQLQEVIMDGTFVKLVIGIDKEEISCTEKWETETMIFLTSLNDIITSCTENRSLAVDSIVQSILAAKQKHILDISSSEDYQVIDEWYITGKQPTAD